jgi:dTDP-4-amino-4,6-dideoxygalactose transaminase
MKGLLEAGKERKRESRRVPFFDYPSIFTEREEELLGVIREVCRRGAFILQSDLSAFEKSLADYAGAPYALGVANGTDALILSLRAAGLEPGDEAIFCSHTFVATAASIRLVGGVPVPVECGPDHLIDPESVEAAITPRTRAIVPTQLNGRTADMEALHAIADRHGLFIVEDAAQALGSKFDGKMAGTFGVAGTISFYPAKNLGAFGDAGLIFAKDEETYRKLALLRDHGRDETGEVVEWGYNSRLDNLQAAILAYKFRDYDAIVARRRQVAARYEAGLKDLGELVLPPGPESDPRHYDVYQNYEIEAERRDELKAYLKERGIGTLIQWGGKAVHQFPALGFDQRLPYVEALFERALLLPMNVSISDGEIDYVCETIREFYRG